VDVLGMQDFDFAQSNSVLPKKNLQEDVAVFPAPTALIESIKLTNAPFCQWKCC